MTLPEANEVELFGLDNLVKGQERGKFFQFALGNCSIIMFLLRLEG